MSLRGLFQFRANDSTADLNQHGSQIARKGVFDAGTMHPSGATGVTTPVVAGVPGQLSVQVSAFVALASDGMVVVHEAPPNVILAVSGGVDQYILCKAVYNASGAPDLQFEVMSSAAWLALIPSEVNKRIVLAKITLAAYPAATEVLSQYIDLRENDLVDKIGRDFIRGVVATFANLPTDGGSVVQRVRVGDVYLVLSTRQFYRWDGATWQTITDGALSLLITNHIGVDDPAHPASVISYVPVGPSVTSNRVQGALDELDAEKVKINGDAMTGQLSITTTATPAMTATSTSATGTGVQGTGGTNGTGGIFTGDGLGSGVQGQGGASGGIGVEGAGGAGSGAGMSAVGGGPDGVGLLATGLGAGSGVLADSLGTGDAVVGLSSGSVAPASSSRGGMFVGTTVGVEGRGKTGTLATGVQGQGGSSGGVGVWGFGTAAQPGVQGDGGFNGPGVAGTGGSAGGVGVQGTGGGGLGAAGVSGTGTGGGVGVTGQGGPTDGWGFSGTGGGTAGLGGSGLGATGGVSGGKGLLGTGGAGSSFGGPGVEGVGAVGSGTTGDGAGVIGRGPSSAIIGTTGAGCGVVAVGRSTALIAGDVAAAIGSAVVGVSGFGSGTPAAVYGRARSNAAAIAGRFTAVAPTITALQIDGNGADAWLWSDGGQALLQGNGVFVEGPAILRVTWPDTSPYGGSQFISSGITLPDDAVVPVGSTTLVSLAPGMYNVGFSVVFTFTDVHGLVEAFIGTSSATPYEPSRVATTLGTPATLQTTLSSTCLLDVTATTSYMFVLKSAAAPPPTYAKATLAISRVHRSTGYTT